MCTEADLNFFNVILKQDDASVVILRMLYWEMPYFSSENDDEVFEK